MLRVLWDWLGVPGSESRLEPCTVCPCGLGLSASLCWMGRDCRGGSASNGRPPQSLVPSRATVTPGRKKGGEGAPGWDLCSKDVASLLRKPDPEPLLFLCGAAWLLESHTVGVCEHGAHFGESFLSSCVFPPTSLPGQLPSVVVAPSDPSAVAWRPGLSALKTQTWFNIIPETAHLARKSFVTHCLYFLPMGTFHIMQHRDLEAWDLTRVPHPLWASVSHLQGGKPWAAFALREEGA